MKEYKFRARFYDADPMGVMWHGNYVKLCEDARCEFWRDAGYTYMQMRDDGFIYPIIKMEFKFIAPILFDDEVAVSIELLECDTIIKFSYRIKSPLGALLAKATTSQAAVELDSKRTLYEIPPQLRVCADKILLKKNPAGKISAVDKNSTTNEISTASKTAPEQERPQNAAANEILPSDNEQ
ncbi:thioesterase family protein [uncultured Campylobacter sp.]|uniref:acyl-CoA thioesterase n=1 Tax=uncultured Campylobacter sp. TaxID=218934 RepID=UPI0026195403|nr:thioesterase family protein [uncultured Campylobacter sp.]